MVTERPMGLRPMSVESTAIDGLMVIRLKEITDERGTVREFYRQSAFADFALPDLGAFLQINLTESRYGALRGLHGEDMWKLVAIAAGSAFGAYVDGRTESPTYGQVVTVELEVGTQVLLPAGVCNAFQTTSTEGSQYLYAFNAEWVPGMAGVAYCPVDPALGISWPVPVDLDDVAQLSVKDRTAPPFPAR